MLRVGQLQSQSFGWWIQLPRYFSNHIVSNPEVDDLFKVSLLILITYVSVICFQDNSPTGYTLAWKPNRRPIIIYIKCDPDHRKLYASLSHNELNRVVSIWLVSVNNLFAYHIDLKRSFQQFITFFFSLRWEHWRRQEYVECRTPNHVHLISCMLRAITWEPHTF